jgi:hypothetical protein
MVCRACVSLTTISSIYIPGYTLPTNVQNGLDLSILTSCLSPQPLVQESDELWEFDSLLQFVSQELTADADAEEAEKTGAAEAAAAATK